MKWRRGKRSADRARWLQAGFDSGNLEACDAFSGEI